MPQELSFDFLQGREEPSVLLVPLVLISGNKNNMVHRTTYFPQSKEGDGSVSTSPCLSLVLGSAEAAACHQGALGSNRSWKGLSSHRTIAGWDLFWPLSWSGPSPHRQMVDLGIDSSAEAIYSFVNSFVTA